MVHDLKKVFGHWCKQQVPFGQSDWFNHMNERDQFGHWSIGFRAYDPAEFESLPVTNEIKDLFQYITRWDMIWLG